MTDCELVLRWAGGELDLMGWNASDHGDFLIETLSDGTEWGNPESVRRSLRRFLLDGSVSVKERDDNRTIPLKLEASAADGVSLAGAEAALALLDGLRCELVWTPPDAFAPAAVFVVVAATLRHDMDDLAELSVRRYYTLTLDCLPHARSDAYVTIPALAQNVSVRTEFDDCTALTGWSEAAANLALGAGFITIEYSLPAGVSTWVQRAGTVDFTTDRYLAVTYAGSSSGVVVTGARMQVGGSWLTLPKIGTDDGADLYDTGGVVVTLIEFEVEGPWGTEGPVDAWASLGQQSSPYSVGSLGKVRTVTVPGSKRTPAAVLVSSATADLGDVVVYSGPDYDPSLVNRRSSGLGHQVSAPPEPDDQTVLYKWPISELPPGDYVAWAQLDASGITDPVTLAFEAELHTTAGLAKSTSLATVAVAAGENSVRPLFAATLPPWDLPAGSAHEFGLRITGTFGGTGGIVAFPWIWLFNVSTGILTIVKAGTASKVWIEVASLDRDHPSVWMGDTTLGVALPASLMTELLAWGGAHVAQPPVSTLYSWSSTATDAAVSATFRPAWHTHPAS